MNWPNKTDSEDFQIKGFIEAYSKFSESQTFRITEKGECPDYVVKDITSNEEYGVELTSVYINDRSVPDVHMSEQKGPVEIPYDENQIACYKRRLITAIIDKICKARKNYSKQRPLILAIYMNEYIGIYLDNEELRAFVKRYDGIFDSMTPFAEIVFWNLVGNRALSVDQKFQVRDTK